MSADVQIIFEIDTDEIKASNTGTYENPLGYPANPCHPNIRIIRGGHAGGATPTDRPPAPPGTLPGDTTVSIYQNQEVMIWCEDSQRRANITVAVVRLALHRWTPGGPNTPETSSNITRQTMDADGDAPIGQAAFSSSATRLTGLEYVSDFSRDWQDTPAYFVQQANWGGVSLSRNSEIIHPRQFHPHVIFQTSDIQGKLIYGLEFSLLVDGEMSGYFWFDPSIFIMDRSQPTGG